MSDQPYEKEGTTYNGLLTRDDLLILLNEECGEVIQAACKCQRFGFAGDHGVGYGRNDIVLAKEMGDLQAIINALFQGLDGEAQDAFLDTRDAKLRKAINAKVKYGPRGEPSP